MRIFKHRSWQGAMCANATDIFFSEEDDPTLESQAKSICAICAIRPRCLDVAIEDDEREGIWGGCNYAERKTIRMRNKRSFNDLVREIEPAIDSVVADYMFAQDILNAKSKVQAMQDLNRKR